MVFTRPFISNSSSPFSNPLVTVPRAPLKIGITVTFMFRSFFFSIPKQGLGIYTSFHFLLILLFGQPGQQSLQFLKLCVFISK